MLTNSQTAALKYCIAAKELTCATFDVSHTSLLAARSACAYQDVIASCRV